MRFDYREHQTREAILRAAWKWFSEVDGPCIDDKWLCKYRYNMEPECDKTCIVGAFIPDEAYNPMMENLRPTRFDTVCKDKGLVYWLTEHGDLFVQLQRVHDSWAKETKETETSAPYDDWRYWWGAYSLPELD